MGKPPLPLSLEPRGAAQNPPAVDGCFQPPPRRSRSLLLDPPPRRPRLLLILRTEKPAWSLLRAPARNRTSSNNPTSAFKALAYIYLIDRAQITFKTRTVWEPRKCSGQLASLFHTEIFNNIQTIYVCICTQVWIQTLYL